MMRKKTKILTLGLLLITACIIALYLWGKEIKKIGELETRWLRLEMWPTKYFNPEKQDLNKTDEIYLKSLTYSPEEKQELLKELATRKCHKKNDECLTILLSVANITIDEGVLDKAKALENQAAKELYQSHACPIKLEITLIKHALKTLKDSPTNKSKAKSRLITETIKNNKGINFNLQTNECNKYAMHNPKLFHTYVMLIAEVMSYGDGSLVKSAAYLRNIDSIKIKGL